MNIFKTIYLEGKEMTLEEELENELNFNYKEACKNDYIARIYKRILNENVGNPKAVIAQILDKEYVDNKPLSGFNKLVSKNLTNLTLEYTAYKKKYRKLLNEEQKHVIVTFLHQYAGMSFEEIYKIK